MYEEKRGTFNGVASPKIWEGSKKLGRAKMLDFRRIALFCLKKRLSKHKMTVFTINVGSPTAPMPPLATPMGKFSPFQRFVYRDLMKTKVHLLRMFSCLRNFLAFKQNVARLPDQHHFNSPRHVIPPLSHKAVILPTEQNK